jgi:hypothetical protein
MADADALEAMPEAQPQQPWTARTSSDAVAADVPNDFAPAAEGPPVAQSHSSKTRISALNAAVRLRAEEARAAPPVARSCARRMSQPKRSRPRRRGAARAASAAGAARRLQRVGGRWGARCCAAKG